MRYHAGMRIGITMFGAATLACGTGSRPEGDTNAPRPVPASAQTRRAATTGTVMPVDAVRLYQSMGLLADGAPVPFVGSVAFLAGKSADSTLALITLSIPNRSLTFGREGDQYQASYQVAVEVRHNGELLLRSEGTEQVRVPMFKETARTDESIIFQQLVSLSPGNGDITITVRDDPSAKSSSASRTLVIPTLDASKLSTPVAFYEVTPRTSTDSLPRIMSSPRSTIVFGRDSVIPLYVEAYGSGDRVLVGATATGEGNARLWADTITLQRHGRLVSGVVRVPSIRLGIGVAHVALRRLDTGDSVSTPVFISLGEDLPVATYTQMVSYLRYFASPGRLSALENAAPEQRAAAWAAFVREIAPSGDGSSDELRAYFQRIEIANARFRDEGTAGWLGERGMVFITLGEPDQIREPNAMDVNQRGKVQIWDYTNRRLQLVFVDLSGFGRWRLTPSSMNDFQSVARSIQEQRR